MIDTVIIHLELALKAAREAKQFEDCGAAPAEITAALWDSKAETGAAYGFLGAAERMVS